MTELAFDVIKIFSLAALASIAAILWCPLLTNFLYKNKLWKKTARQKAISGEDAVVFNSLHKEKEVSTPRMGGLLIWITTIFIIFLFYFLSAVFPKTWIVQFNFLSRGQTWLPLFTLVVASIVGLIDDILVTRGLGKYIGGGISFKKRLLIVILIGFIGSIWFYQKLGWDTVYIPFVGDVGLGLWYIPLFDLAAFCAVVSGTLFAFLWFNIPPARFYMGETGILGLTAVLSVIAFLTDSIYVLPIIGGLLIIEVLSVIIQLLSKKYRKQKIFISTPIHHHFEAMGWPSYKVTMRAWIIGIVLAIVGVAVRLLR